MKILGLILIVAGVLALIYGGFTYVKDRDTTELGPIDITVEDKESVKIPPIVGGLALAGGVVLVLASRKKLAR